MRRPDHDELPDDKDPFDQMEDELLPVLSSLPYQALREALYKDGFRMVEDSTWPTAKLDKGSSRGYAQLLPPAADTLVGMSDEDKAAFRDMAHRQAQEMSDTDADALDALAAIWLRTADSRGGATTTVDELLEMRGVKPKMKAGGSRSGYRPEQRREIMRALSRLQSIWLNMAEVETYELEEGHRRPRKVKRSLQSRPFIITDRLGGEMEDGSFRVSTFRFRPGDVFAAFLSGPGRQTALLSARALKYDPYRQTIEKRLTRYLSWQWRTKATNGRLLAAYRVRTLLDAVDIKFDSRWATRQRERLENALDTLDEDGVIATWEYEDWDASKAKGRSWAHNWLQVNVLIEPPPEIEQQYSALELPSHRERQHRIPPRSTDPEASTLGQRVKQRRLENGLTQLQVAQELGINRGHLSKIEKDAVSPSAKLRKHIVAWLGLQST